MKVDLTKRQIEVILECLENIWDCIDDQDYFLDAREQVRLRVIQKLRKIK